MVKSLFILTIVILLLSSSVQSINDEEAGMEKLEVPRDFLEYPFSIPNWKSISGTVRHVGGSGPGNYTGIGEALNDSEEGDTLVVHSGEYAESILVNRSVSLIGIGKPVLNGSSNPGDFLLNIISDNVTVQGFEFREEETALNLNCSGFMIIDNSFFWNKVDILLEFTRTAIDRNLTFFSSTLKNNTFTRAPSVSMRNSCEISLDIGFDGSGKDLEVGNLHFNDNRYQMNNTLDTAIYMEDWVRVDDLHGGDVIIDTVSMKNNTITGGSRGIVLSSNFNSTHDRSIDLENILISENRFTSQSEFGISASTPGLSSPFSTTMFECGELRVEDNIISLGPAGNIIIGIKAVSGYTEDLSGNSSYFSGNITIIENQINMSSSGSAEPIGIFYESSNLGVNMNGSSVCRFSGVMIDSNEIKGDGCGIRFDVEKIGSYLKDHASVDVGPLGIAMNDIQTDIGIDSGYFSTIGCNLRGNSSSRMGNLSINDNMIRADDYGIRLNGISSLGCALSDDAVFTWEGFGIKENDIESGTYWISNDKISDLGSGLFQNSRAYFGPIMISENRVNDSKEDRDAFNIEGMAYDMHDYSILDFQGISFVNNTFTYSTLLAGGLTKAAYLLYDRSQARIGPLIVSRNRVNALEKTGLEVYFGNIGYNLHDDSKVEFLGVSVDNNSVFCLRRGIFLNSIQGLGFNLHNNSFVRSRGISVENNSINSEVGIQTSSIEHIGDLMDGSSRFEGDRFSFGHNQINSSGYGIHLNGWAKMGYRLSGESHAEFGGLCIHDNLIESGSTSIEVVQPAYLGSVLSGSSKANIGGIDIIRNDVEGSRGITVRNSMGIGYDLKETSEAFIGAIRINENDVESEESGILIQKLEESLNLLIDESMAHFRMIEVSSNRIVSGDTGIGMTGIDQVAMYLRDSSLTEMDPIRILENHVRSGENSITIRGNYMMTSLSHSSTARWGGIDVSDNILISDEFGIAVELSNLVHGINSWSRAEIGPMHFDRNNIEALNGLQIDIREISTFNSSFLSLGPLTVNGTDFNVEGNAIKSNRMITTHHSSRLELGRFRIENCIIDCNGGSYGLHISDLHSGERSIIENGEVFLNDIHSARQCLDLNSTTPMFVYLNNFNDFHVPGSSSSNNTVFNSPENITYKYLQNNYESKLGNHWQGHTDPDADGDGIVDIPYKIGSVQDSYPLKFNWSELYPPIEDNLAPDLFFLFDDGDIYLEDEITLEWSATDSGVGLKHCLVRLDQGAIINNGRATFRRFESLDDGRHSLEITAADFIGNSITSSIVFYIDTKPPNASILGPSQGIILGPDDLPPVLNWSSFDEGTWITDVFYSIDNGSGFNTSEASGEVIWESVLDDGWHELTMEVVDGAGRVLSVNSTFAVDTKAPAIFFKTLKDGAFINTSELELLWEISENISGLKSQSTRIDGSQWSSIGKATRKTFYGLSEGPHLIEISIEDNIGNSERYLIDFTVDMRDPTLNIQGISDGSSTRSIYLDIFISSNGTGSGISSLNVTLDGELLSMDEGSLGLGPLNDGDHTIFVQAMDMAGNRANRSVTFRVDTLAPDVIDHGPRGEGVPTNSEIFLVFNEEISHAEVYLESPFIGGEITVSGNRVVFDPSGDMERSTEYAIGIRFHDPAGNTDEYLIHFETADLTTGWGSLRGMLKDSDGNPIRGAKVLSGESFRTTTDINGLFKLDLPEGKNRVEITASGFKKMDFYVTLESGEVTEIDEYVMEESKEDDDSKILPIAIVVILVIIALIIGLILFMKGRKYEVEEEDALIFEMEEEDDYFDDLDFE